MQPALEVGRRLDFNAHAVIAHVDGVPLEAQLVQLVERRRDKELGQERADRVDQHIRVGPRPKVADRQAEAGDGVVGGEAGWGVGLVEQGEAPILALEILCGRRLQAVP